MMRGGAVGLTLAAMLVLAGCGAREAEQAEAAASTETPRTVRVVRVENRALSGGLTATGRLEPREEAAVGAELAGYRVARVLVDEGAVVGAGQPLVQLDDTLLRAQVDQAAATVQQQRVAAEQASREAQRVQGLAQEGVLATEAVEERRFAAERARAAVRAAEAQLAELQTRRQRLTVRSPVSGRVLERTIRPGDISGAGGSPWFRIARGGLLELSAELGEPELALIRPGDRASVALPGGETAEGVVRLIEPEIDAQTRLGRARILLTPGPGQRAGGFGTASFTQVQTSARAVPEAAVRYTSDGPTMMVVGPQNRVRQLQVRTGRRANGYVELTQGPEVGTLVLLGGASFVLQGDRVKPVIVQPQGPAQAARASAPATPAPAATPGKAGPAR
jgi:HlyD family secretion protein